MLLLNPRRTRTNMKLLQLVWIFLLTLCGQSGTTTITVKEGGEAILDCSFGATSIENEPFTWKKDVDKSNEEVFWFSDGQTDPGKEFRGRVSHFPDQLRFGNASIKITKAKPSDSGNYTCYHATVKKEIKSNISLTVGASPQPVVSLHRSNDGVLLKCEVKGASPEPVVEWWDSDGNVLPADTPQVEPQPGNKYNIILTYPVTKTDDYRCVSTQKEINHQIYFETHVPGPGGASKPIAKEINETKDGVLLQCIVQDPSPQTKVSWKDKSGNLVPSKEQKTENSIILWTTVTKAGHYRCVTTEGKKDDEVYDEIRVRGPEESNTEKSSGDGFGVGTIVSVALAVALVAVLITAVVSVVITTVVVRRFKSNTGGSTTDRSIEVNGVHSPLKQDV